MTDATNGEALLPVAWRFWDEELNDWTVWSGDTKFRALCEKLGMRCEFAYPPTASAGMVVVPEDAPKEFVDYFVKNYPGPNTIIGNPWWHVPKIWRAARYAMLAAHESATNPNEIGSKSVGDSKRPIVWQQETEYGPGYSFASEEVMNALGEYLSGQAHSGENAVTDSQGLGEPGRLPPSSLVEFARWVLEQAGDGCDIEGCDAQDEAERLGLVVKVEATEPCSEINCSCAEVVGEFPVECYRYAPGLFEPTPADTGADGCQRPECFQRDRLREHMAGKTPRDDADYEVERDPTPPEGE